MAFYKANLQVIPLTDGQEVFSCIDESPEIFVI